MIVRVAQYNMTLIHLLPAACLEVWCQQPSVPGHPATADYRTTSRQWHLRWGGVGWQAVMSAPVLMGVQRLLAVLLSDSVGLALLAHNGAVVAALLAALDPAAAGEGGFALDDNPADRCGICAVAALGRAVCCSGLLDRLCP